MIPQNPMFVIKNKKNNKYMNASTGAMDEGPATIFKDHKSIEAFCHFYSGEEFDFEIIEVDLVEKDVVSIEEVKQKKKIKESKEIISNILIEK